MLHVLRTSGFKQSVCDQSFYNGPISKFWACAFVLSKAPELGKAPFSKMPFYCTLIQIKMSFLSTFLGDTIFIVLRKQRLIFLHWYHHITVLVYSWYSYKDQVAGGGWFMTMNYTVHALMYSYYAARAAGLRVPKPCAIIITSSQIAQMAMGLAVSALVYRWMQDGDCPSYVDNIVWASLMYLSYLLLFTSFFYQSYVKGLKPTGIKTD